MEKEIHVIKTTKVDRLSFSIENASTLEALHDRGINGDIHIVSKADTEQLRNILIPALQLSPSNNSRIFGTPDGVQVSLLDRLPLYFKRNNNEFKILKKYSSAAFLHPHDEFGQEREDTYPNLAKIFIMSLKAIHSSGFEVATTLYNSQNDIVEIYQFKQPRRKIKNG